MPRRLVNLISPRAQARTRFRSLRENLARNHHRGMSIVRWSLSHIHVYIYAYVCDARFASIKRGVPHAEYRDRLSRTRATRAAAASGLWTGWHQSTRSVLYLRISHSRGRVSALMLARSFARIAARRFCTRAVPPRPRRSIFFSFLPDICGGRTQASRLVHAGRYYLWVL